MIAARTSLALSLLAAYGLASSSAHAQQAESPDQRDIRQAEALSSQGKYGEAAAAFENVVKTYPTSVLAPMANLGAAINYFFNKEYDKAVAAAEKNLSSRTATPEILERCAVLIPQIISTKASDLPPTQTAERKKAFQDAVAKYDEFIAKYPASQEVETALYGKGRSLAQIEDYDAAADALKQALDKFPQSPTILDSKYLRGLVLMQSGAKTTPEGTADDKAKAALAESEKTFREIIAARNDLALMNSSFMQLGNVLSLKASQAPADSEEQQKLNEQALEQFREVRPKEIVQQVQDQRVKYYDAQAQASVRDLPKFQQWKRIAEKAREKLNEINGTPDQSVEAKLKAGQIFLVMKKYDEARVLLKFAENFVAEEDKDQKKLLSYFEAVTYAAQHVPEQSVAAYEKFKGAYAGDPVAENLPLLVGAVFLDTDPKINNLDTAIKYFDEQIATYPKSKYSAQALMSKASALISQKRYDEALKSLEETLKTQKDKDLLMQAEFALATVQREMNKNEEAVKTFKSVRDKYTGSEQAEQSAFWVGQITGAMGDAKTSLTELSDFITKFPKSQLMANALYFKARAQAQTNDRSGSLTTYKELIDGYKDSEPAQPAYFEMASMLQHEADEKAAAATGEKPKPDYTAVYDLMKEFISKYPTSERLFSAYDFSAQLAIKAEKQEEAIKFYDEYVAKHSDKPEVARAHLQLATIWKTKAEKLGPFLALSKADQDTWKEGMQIAVKNCEDGIVKQPESDMVSQLLETLLKIEVTRMQVGLKKADELKGYIQGLADKFQGKSTRSKILFGLANFLADNDREKKTDWFKIMADSFDQNLIYSPADMDRYSGALIDQKKYPEATAILDKLGKDYPVPPNVEPARATRSVGDAQAIVMAGRARILQAEGKAAEGQKILEQLKTTFPWSGKVMEANYGIGAGLFEQGKYEEAIEVLGNVAKSNTGSPKLRAQSMMLVAKALEKLGKFEEAINNYIKIATFFEAERDLAAEGLWRGSQLIEKQVTGEIPRPKPKPAASPTPKGKASPAAKAKAAQH